MLSKKGMISRPETLGHHLRNQRLMMGLRQDEVAKQLGALREVYDRWERNERKPVVSEWPGILSFLGYYPAREETAADLVLKARRCQGFDQKALAKAVGVIHQRLRRWEHSEESIPPDFARQLASLASIPPAIKHSPVLSR